MRTFLDLLLARCNKRALRTLFDAGVAQVPEALMRRDQALDAAAAVAVLAALPPRGHQLQGRQQQSRDIQVSEVAGMMKARKKLVEKPPRVPGRLEGRCLFVSQAVEGLMIQQ